MTKSIIPNTKEEINLADGLALLDQYYALKTKLNNANRGENILDEISMNNIKQKYLYLNSERNRLIESGNILTDNDLKHRIDDLNKEMREINDQLYDNTIFDQEEISYFETELLQSKTKLFKFLKQNISPDLFLIYSKILFRSLGLANPSEEIFNAIKVHDNVFRIQINNVGINLVACALNYPCDKDSSLVQDICIGRVNPEKFACGKSLEDYYFNYLLGPNQTQDIENYLNYMLKHYAKN
jgi:hypothetical protein